MHSTLGTDPNACAPLDEVLAITSTVGDMTNLLDSVARIVTTAGAKASYGEPVTVGGIEMVPVSVVWFGFGAGGDELENGGGGGGGGSVPVGAYVRGPNGMRFKPNPVTLIAVLTPLVWAISMGFAGAARRRR